MEVCYNKLDENCNGKIDDGCGWSRSIQGSHGGSITIDSTGNLYITGRFWGKETRLNSWVPSYLRGLYVIKVSPKGKLIWGRSAGGLITPVAIKRDSKGDIYIAGYFSDFEDAIFGATTLQSKGKNDIFVAKLNDRGEFLWVTATGGPKEDGVYGLDIDSKDRVVITGTFSNVVSFGNKVLSSRGFNDGFVAQLNSQGRYLWITSFGGKDKEESMAVALDSLDHIYITGRYYLDIVVGGWVLEGNKTPPSFYSRLAPHTIIAKLSPKGQWEWATSISRWSEGQSIAIDRHHSIYVGGKFSGIATFGHIRLGAWDCDMFVAKLDTQGQFLWVARSEGLGDARTDGITVGPKGSIYTTGRFGYSYPFGLFRTEIFGDYRLRADGEDGIFVVKLSQEGLFTGAISTGGQGRQKDAWADGIVTDTKGRVFIIGRFSGKAVRFGASQPPLSANRGTFIWKLDNL